MGRFLSGFACDRALCRLNDVLGGHVEDALEIIDGANLAETVRNADLFNRRGNGFSENVADSGAKTIDNGGVLGGNDSAGVSRGLDDRITVDGF